MQLKGAKKDVRMIGRDLGVRYVLEGGVRKAGNSLPDHGPIDRRADRCPPLVRQIQRHARRLAPGAGVAADMAAVSHSHIPDVQDPERVAYAAWRGSDFPARAGQSRSLEGGARQERRQRGKDSSL